MRSGCLPLLLLFTGCASEFTSVQGGVGPVVGYVPGRGLSWGWEGGGLAVTGETRGLPDVYLHFNTGMSWRPGAKPAASKDLLSYLVWEPVLYVVPLTLGFSHSTEEGSNAMAGTWVGLPAPISGGCRSGCAMVSVALGYRWSGLGEFYLTPKVGLLRSKNAGSP